MGLNIRPGRLSKRMAAINDDVSVRQRLNTVEQGESGKARREQREIGAAKCRCAALDVGGRILRCDQGLDYLDSQYWSVTQHVTLSLKWRIMIEWRVAN